MSVLLHITSESNILFYKINFLCCYYYGSMDTLLCCLSSNNTILAMVKGYIQFMCSWPENKYLNYHRDEFIWVYQWTFALTDDVGKWYECGYWVINHFINNCTMSCVYQKHFQINLLNLCITYEYESFSWSWLVMLGAYLHSKYITLKFL